MRSWLTKRSIVVTMFALLSPAFAGPSKSKLAERPHPIMRVGKFTKAPVIDGKIGKDEWKHASAFTGVVAEGSVGGHGSMVPEVQQVQWYLGYDDKFLYLAMRSPQPKGTYPVARVKENDLVAGCPPILFEDHVEVQILSHGRRDLATKQGKGFYKIMVNAKGAYIDQYLYNGTIGTEELWSMGGPVKCSVTPEAWELEMAVEIKRMKVKNLDNRALVIQLVRTDSCTGMYFAGWVGATWLSWQRFAQVNFSPKSPAFRFLKLGEIGAGEIDANIQLVGNGEAADVSVDLSMENADGKEIYKDSKTVSLKADGQENLTFKKSGIPISKVAIADHGRRNQFEIKATAKIGKKTVVLYHNRCPFMQFDEEFRKNFLDKWIAGRPQSGEWSYKFAYLPYSNKMEASVDLDFFGIPKEIQNADAFSIKVTKKGDSKVLGEGNGKVIKMVGKSILIDLPQLPAGEYTTHFELTAGGKVVSKKEADFVRKKYQWEHNKLGLSDEVIPPFEPLTTNKNRIYLWKKYYEIGNNGLPAQINVGVPTGTFGGPADLLSAPIHFEVVQKGKAIQPEGGSCKIDKAQMHRVDVSGQQTTGPLKADVKSFVEYDGWYEVTAKLSGEGNVDAVDLVIDFKDQPGCPVDTLYVQRMGDGRVGNRFSDISRKPGVFFKSTELMKYRGGKFDWKSFVPRTYIGNGDRGLWFFAWSATGWELKDNQAVTQIERLKNGNVRLRVRILAGPVDLSKGRTVRFALQAAPVKANHPRYRTFNEENLDMHDTRGYRDYGISVDGFVNKKPEDYEALRKFILYGMRYEGETQKKAKGNYYWWHGHYTNKVAHGAAVTMYGSGQLMGMGAEEFKTFGGEWLGKSNWHPNRSAAADMGRWNYQGTSQWLKDAQLSVTGVNWTQSMIDFFVWYHKPLLEKAGFNGTWWDNTSISTERVYNPELKRMEEIWYLYPRRQLVKRLNVMGWKLMRPPRWATNMHVDLGFSQTFWMVENDWYADGPDMTSLDHYKMGQFRSMARTKSTMQVARPWLRGFYGTTPEMDRKIKRSLWAIMMSHDIHPNVLSHYAFQKPEYREIRRTMASLRGLVNLPDTHNCLFAGYWKTEAMVKPAGKTIYASVYTNANLQTAAVLFFNGEKKDQYLAGTELDINALIPVRHKTFTAKRIFDIETGKTVATSFKDGKYVITEPYLVKGHEFRLLGIEAE